MGAECERVRFGCSFSWMDSGLEDGKHAINCDLLCLLCIVNEAKCLSCFFRGQIQNLSHAVDYHRNSFEIPQEIASTVKSYINRSLLGKNDFLQENAIKYKVYAVRPL